MLSLVTFSLPSPPACLTAPDIPWPLALPHPRLPSHLLSWLVGIAEGLAYLHANKIIHRDIRAESIFLTDDDVSVTVVRVEGRVGGEEEGWVGGRGCDVAGAASEGGPRAAEGKRGHHRGGWGGYTPLLLLFKQEGDSVG